MRGHFLWVPLLALAFAPCTAGAVVVDFSSVSGTVDLLTPNNLSLDEVRFTYDDFGSGVDFAQADSAGIVGTNGGALIVDFSDPITQLLVDFSLFDGLSADLPDALAIDLYLNGTPVLFGLADAAYSGDGTATGSYVYSGAPIDRATLFFAPDAPYFTLDSLSYEPEIPDVPPDGAVPEPASLSIWALGIVGLIGWRFRRKRWLSPLS